METMVHLQNVIFGAGELVKGAIVRIKLTGQIVELKSVSVHGIAIVSFSTGDDCFISNRFLEPVPTLH